MGSEMCIRDRAQTLERGGLRVVSGGTDNHLVLVDVTPFGINGKEAEDSLGLVNITVNKNAIPFDTRSPRITSGLRLGTASVTTRGFGIDEMKQIGGMIVKLLSNKDTDKTNVRREIREDVKSMTSKFNVPGLDT